MRTAKKDLTGQVFGELTVIKEDEPYITPSTGYPSRQWLCRCSCGNTSVVRQAYLINGHTTSCGWCQKIKDCGSYFQCTIKDGSSFIFDRCDLPIVESHRWNKSRDGYFSVTNGHKVFRLHRVIMQATPDDVVDHINGDKTDNRRCNLRLVSQNQNSYNSGMRRNSSTGYKGVCYIASNNKYLAHIHPSGKMKSLGYYDTPEAAALAYNQAAISLFGEFARINVIGQPFKTVAVGALESTLMKESDAS